MGAFNILSSEIQCSNCQRTIQGQIQFRFGDTWQFQYQIGDKIKWGGNDTGEPGIPKVKVYGIVETSECSICGGSNILDEFDIRIENDIILEVTPMHSLKDYFVNDGNYRVLVKNRL